MVISSLSPSQNAALLSLKRLGFATVDQLQYWSHFSDRQLRKSLISLEAQGFVTAEKMVKPYVWRLGHFGARIMEASMPSGKRPSSWSVTSHACHLNRVEIFLREDFSNFKFLSKKELFPLGLNPSFGEHGGWVGQEEMLLLLLDDHRMPSYRISRTLLREHKRNRKYCALYRAVNWAHKLKKFVIVTTERSQEKKHARWIKRHKIEADLVYLPPIWAY